MAFSISAIIYGVVCRRGAFWRAAAEADALLQQDRCRHDCTAAWWGASEEALLQIAIMWAGCCCVLRLQRTKHAAEEVAGSAAAPAGGRGVYVHANSRCAMLTHGAQCRAAEDCRT